MNEEKMEIVSENNKAVVGNRIKLSLKIGAKILILEDRFKSAYDCAACGATGKITGSCLRCDGTGEIEVATEVVTSEEVAMKLEKVSCGKCDGTGKKERECDLCHGKGMLLEIPDIAKSRPTSGVILAIGPACTIAKVGDRVAYTGYTGHLVPFKGNSRVRVMLENEPICWIEDVEGEEGPTVEFVDKDTAYDLQ